MRHLVHFIDEGVADADRGLVGIPGFLGFVDCPDERVHDGRDELRLPCLLVVDDHGFRLRGAAEPSAHRHDCAAAEERALGRPVRGS